MKKVWFLVISSFVVGFFVGVFPGHRLLDMQELGSKGLELHQGGYSYINPLLECGEDGANIEFVELKSFKEDLQKILDSLKARKWLRNGAIYFRDLNNGPWFGINEKEKFTPASLFKVPLMMAYYKEAETNPNVLHHRIRFEGLQDENAPQLIRPSEWLEPGKTYPVQELIRRMIVYSDNNAAALLNKDFNQEKLIAVFTDLSIPVPIGATDNTLTVKQYATFFRILFNASYLNREMSMKALELLAETEFKDGIVAGVPTRIHVVHKFGERVYPGKNNEKQMHDCGIVYYPEHPYLLCIMTKGESFDHLDDAIKEISSFVFKNIDNQLRNN